MSEKFKDKNGNPLWEGYYTRGQRFPPFYFEGKYISSRAIAEFTDFSRTSHSFLKPKDIKDFLPIDNVGDYVVTLMAVAEAMTVVQYKLEKKAKTK